MWQRWVRRALLGLSLIFAGSLVYILLTRTQIVFSTGPDGPQPLAESNAGIEKFTFTKSHGGVIQWEIQAERAHLVDGDHRAVLDDVRVTLYGQGTRQLTLEGERGTVDTRSRDFVLSNGQRPLAVELEGGYTVYTNTLGWTGKEREVHTNDAVRIVGNGIEMSGRGLIGRLDIGEFHVQHDVKVRIAS